MSIYENKRLTNRNINISLKNKYVYFGIQKAASTTIRNTLSNYELKDLFKIDVPHNPHFINTPFVKPYQLSEQQFTDIMKDQNFLKFTFIRNPYDRILSAYLDKIVGGELRGNFLKTKSDSENKNKVGKLKTNILNVLGFSEKVSFEQFVEVITQIEDKRKNIHWKPMSFILDYPHTKFDFIGKIENFDQDFKTLQDLLNIDLTNYYIKHDRHKTNAAKAIEHYYTPALKKKIAEHYSDDFKLGGYQP